MRNTRHSKFRCADLLKSALPLALTAACLGAADADARRGGGSGGGPGWSGGGRHGGSWSGGGRHGGGWHGGGAHGGRWHGGGHGGWHGHRHWYPGLAWGVGAGVALTYPWWGWGWGYPYGGWGYPYDYYGVVANEPMVELPAPTTGETPAYRWYCPAPPGYHPDVAECTQEWLRVLPEGSVPHSPPPSR